MKQTRDVRRTCSFSEAEDRDIEAAASREGLTVTAYIRQAALKRARDAQ